MLRQYGNSHFFTIFQPFTYSLTYSMVQNPSWEANLFAASKEIPRISRNPNVHYRTHKRPSPVSILGQPNPVYIPTSHLLEIHPNIINSYYADRVTKWDVFYHSYFPTNTVRRAQTFLTCAEKIKALLSNRHWFSRFHDRCSDNMQFRKSVLFRFPGHADRPAPYIRLKLKSMILYWSNWFCGD